MILPLLYPRYPFLDFLRTRRLALLGHVERLQAEESRLRGEYARAPSVESKAALRAARVAAGKAVRALEGRESVSLAVRGFLVAAYLCPNESMPAYGLLQAGGRERVGNTSVSLSPCEPVYVVVLRRTGLRTLHNLVDHLLAAPAVVEMAHALFRLSPEEHAGAVADACALASEEVADNHDNARGNGLS